MQENILKISIKIIRKKIYFKIAKGQLASEQNTTLLDTDLITIKIWSNYKYGNCNKWILNQIQKQKSEKCLSFIA